MRLSYFRVIAFAAVLAVCATQAAAQKEAKTADGISVGEALFNKRCAQCHSLSEGKNGNGPSLFRIIGREAAVVPGFKYSRAIRRMAADESLKWSEENLAAFLTRPSLLVPGTRMAFPGVKKEEDLTKLVAWIKTNSGPPSGDP